MKTDKKKSIVTITVAAALAAIMAGAGTTLAVMSKTTEKRANNFTFGNVNIQLEEPGWEEEDHTLYPGRTVNKDPAVRNTGSTDIFVYLEVQVPKGEVRLVKDSTEDGRITVTEASQTVVLLDYKFDDKHWAVIHSNTYESYNTIVYAYLEALPAGSSTVPLFEKVTFVNAIEGDPEGRTTLEMPINAYAIQATYLDEIDGMKEADTLEKKLKLAFDTAFTLNEGQTGQ